MKLKESNGNMYNWVTHTHWHIGGECPHKCVYCYENRGGKRAPDLCGPLKLNEESFAVHMGEGKKIFIDHRNDLFCKEMPSKWISRVLAHCETFPDNQYIFQTKNPSRYFEFHQRFERMNCLLGCTIETNRDLPNDFTTAPQPSTRARQMETLTGHFRSLTTFITIEPLVQFDLDKFLQMLVLISPNFIKVGMDSKKNNLSEPTVAEVEALLFGINKMGVEMREKHNLTRLLGYDAAAADAPWRKGKS